MLCVGLITESLEENGKEELFNGEKVFLRPLKTLDDVKNIVRARDFQKYTTLSMEYQGGVDFSFVKRCPKCNSSCVSSESGIALIPYWQPSFFSEPD